MKKAKSSLPNEYKLHLCVDLQKDKKLSIFINLFAILVVIAMAVPMHFAIPIVTLFDISQGMFLYFIRFGVLLFGIIFYMVLHESVHGIAMKLCGTKKVKYGFTGLYAFAGSTDYYSKASYIFIALSPVVLLGIILLIVNLFVSNSWFWVVYIIQILNISGAVGDAYVTVRFAKSPKDILIQDSGTAMTVYIKE